MNFMEAVKAMKEGKQLTRTNCEWYTNKDIYPAIRKWYYSKDVVEPLEIEDIEATDWEIFEDKDWNYSDELKDALEKIASGFYSEQEGVLQMFKIGKKCRDLIIKDCDRNIHCDEVIDITNKRFGDLE